MSDENEEDEDDNDPAKVLTSSLCESNANSVIHVCKKTCVPQKSTQFYFCY